MDKHSFKKEIVKIFATTQIKKIDINDEFKELYINSIMKSLMVALPEFIEDGRKIIAIKPHTFHKYDVSEEYRFGDSQNSEVWQIMAPIIEAQLRDFGIPFSTRKNEQTNETETFVILIEDLRIWSNAETAGILL